MLLEPQDVELFFKLHRALMFFVNQRLKVRPDDIVNPDEFSSLSPEVRLKVRDAFRSQTDLIQSFVAENPACLTSDELDIVRSWRHLVHGKFYVPGYKRLGGFGSDGWLVLPSTRPLLANLSASPSLVMPAKTSV